MNARSQELLRQAAIEDIVESFADVDRKGATSWAQAQEMDYYEPTLVPETDTHWTQLIDDMRFNAGTISAFSFLDARGFRYYLPIAMIREIRKPPEQFNLSDLLTQSRFNVERWASLTAAHSACIARYSMIRFLSGDSDWDFVYDHYWKHFLEPL